MHLSHEGVGMTYQRNQFQYLVCWSQMETIQFHSCCDYCIIFSYGGWSSTYDFPLYQNYIFLRRMERYYPYNSDLKAKERLTTVCILNKNLSTVYKAYSLCAAILETKRSKWFLWHTTHAFNCCRFPLITFWSAPMLDNLSPCHNVGT